MLGLIPDAYQIITFLVTVKYPYICARLPHKAKNSQSFPESLKKLILIIRDFSYTKPTLF